MTALACSVSRANPSPRHRPRACRAHPQSAWPPRLATAQCSVPERTVGGRSDPSRLADGLHLTEHRCGRCSSPEACCRNDMRALRASGMAAVRRLPGRARAASLIAAPKSRRPRAPRRPTKRARASVPRPVRAARRAGIGPARLQDRRRRAAYPSVNRTAKPCRRSSVGRNRSTCRELTSAASLTSTTPAPRASLPANIAAASASRYVALASARRRLELTGCP